MSFFIKILFVVHLINCIYCFTCKDENNKPVDWYVLYKLPNEHSSNRLIKTGVAYMYITSIDDKIKWKLSNLSINNSISIPGLTLQPCYDKQTSMHILYNDESPSGAKNENLGHTKGVVLSNNSSGFWLIHSVPKYPPQEFYYYPETGMRYGQSFLCISFNLININNIGKQLQFNEPQVYDTYITKDLQQKLTNINAVINKEFVKTAPWFQLISLSSMNGVQFLSFAKSRKFGKELYEDWLANALQASLFVESWLNGSGKIPSDCSKTYTVRNVKEINSSYATFSSSKDHSKWAITHLLTSNRKWICIGDINREEKQKHRGGGTVCTFNQELWNIYAQMIADTEPCENEI